MDTMIELPALRRSAELVPNTADADTRTVEVVWSAGVRVGRATFFGEPYDEELSLDRAHVRLDRLNAGAPFLTVHELDTLDAVIGSVMPCLARIENGAGSRWCASSRGIPSSCMGISGWRMGISRPTTRPSGEQKLTKRREDIPMTPPRSDQGFVGMPDAKFEATPVRFTAGLTVSLIGVAIILWAPGHR